MVKKLFSEVFKTKENLWAREQEQLIEDALEQAFLNLKTFGPMHRRAVERLLISQGYDQKITNARGETTDLARVAAHRLRMSRRTKTIRRQTLILYGGAIPEENDVHEEQLVKAMENFGGAATLGNLEQALFMQGFGPEAIKSSIEKLQKYGKAQTTTYFARDSQLLKLRDE